MDERIRRKRLRNQYVSLAQRGQLEIARQDTDDAGLLAVERNRLAHDVRIAAEAVRPQTVRQECSFAAGSPVRPPPTSAPRRRIFFPRKIPPQQWLDSECGKKCPLDVRTLHACGWRLRDVTIPNEIKRCGGRERGLSLAPLSIIGSR